MPATYELRDKILKSGRLVFDLRQLANLALFPPDYARVYSSRLVKKGFARRIMEGVISLTEDPLIIATQLLEPSYVSFTSALYVRGLVRQAPALVECVTTKKSFKLKEPRIEYHKILPHLYFGYGRIERYGSYVWVASPEKAILDMVYFGANYGLRLSFRKDLLLQIGHEYELHGGNRGRRVKEWVREHAR